MARIAVSGIDIDYELLGSPDAPPIALTPGGRFSKESQGVPELAKALVDGGHRVLVWDRPNCGASDISFNAENESVLHGQTLTKLIRALDLGPTALVAGSAGSRTSLIAAAHDPAIVSHLAIWWISGGPISLLMLATFYCCNAAMAANHGGMAAVAALPDWADQIKRNPKNREILLAQDPEKFIATMERWAMSYVPSETSPVPGISAADFARINMPTLIYRSGASDLSHTRRTSEWVHELIPHSQLIEPPWPDDEWKLRSAHAAKHGGTGHFANWPDLAPAILKFIATD